MCQVIHFVDIFWCTLIDLLLHFMVYAERSAVTLCAVELLMIQDTL